MTTRTVGEWPESELVMISAIQHYSYCPRQCALIHLEQTFDENLYTMRGRRVHENVDQVDWGYEYGVRFERSLSVWSARLGLIGKADMVEFHVDTPYPVEYKHGPKREQRHDDLQLCAQAICLEEMTGVPVPSGAIYHFSSRRRREVKFNTQLRQRVNEITQSIRNMLLRDELPVPVSDKRCRHCSLVESCMPDMISNGGRILRLTREVFHADN